MMKKMKVELKNEEREKDGKEIIKVVMRKWMKDGEDLIKMIEINLK